MLRDIQHNNLTEFLIDEYRKAGLPIDVDTLFNIQQSAARNVASSSLYSAYEIPYNDKIDIGALNASLKMLYLDYKTLIDFHQRYVQELRKYELASEVYNRMIVKIGNRVLNNATAIISGSIIEGISTYIKPSDVVDKPNTTMDVTDDSVSLLTKSIIAAEFTISDDDVKETIEAPSTFRAFRTGSKSAIFSAVNRNIYSVKIVTPTMIPIVLRLDIPGDFSDVNKVIINTINDPSSIVLMIEISIDGKTYTKVANEQIKDVTSTIDFAPISGTTHIRFSFYKQSGRTIVNGNYEYSYNIKSIALFKGTYESTTPVFQTQKITLNKKVRKVSLIAEESKQPGVDIKYSITSHEKDNQPTGWIEIEPANRSNKTNNIIDLFPRLQTIRNIRPTGSEWKSHRIRGTDVDLYNILEGCSSDLPADITIDNQSSPEALYKYVLNISEDMGTIDESSIKLYRGLYDWAITKNNRKQDMDSTVIEHYLEEGHSGVGYRPLDLKIRITDEMVKSDPSDPTSRTIITKYKVYDLSTITIREDSGAEIMAVPIEIAGTNSIHFDMAIDPLSIYHISYNTKIKDVEEEDGVDIKINVNSLVVQSNTYGILQKDVDYTFGEAVNRIFLSSKKYKGMKSLSISCIYSVYMEKDFPIYETYAYVDDDTTIQIVKFNRKEIEKGNFHEIDGINVSDRDSYVISKGWHRIATTQVYPTNSNNDNDLNPFTNEKSDACILIPVSVYYRGFKESLRKVSPFILGNNIKPKDYRSFAYKEGMILINRVPDYIKEDLLKAASSTDHITANQLLGKKLSEETPAPGVDYYLPYPERFDLEFSILGTDDEDDADNYQSDYIYLKIEPTNIETEGQRLVIRNIFINNLSKE